MAARRGKSQARRNGGNSSGGGIDREGACVHGAKKGREEEGS
mgnify:CR=1 FL=1